MIGHKKKSVPIFASDLGLLEPVSRPAGDLSLEENNAKELKTAQTKSGNTMVDNVKSSHNVQVLYLQKEKKLKTILFKTDIGMKPALA